MSKTVFGYIAAIFCIIFFSIARVYPQQPPGYHSLLINISARAAGMAGSFVAIAGDESGIFSNPAGLEDLTEDRWKLSYVNHILDIYGSQIAVVKSVVKGVKTGLGLRYINYGEFKKIDADGLYTGQSFSAYDQIAVFSVSKKLKENLNLGLNFKYILSQIESYSSSAVAFDLGFIYSTWIDGLIVGGGVFNLGRVNRPFIETEDELPLKYEIGFSKTLAHLPLLLSGELGSFRDGEFIFTLGGEFNIIENFFVRAGISSNRFNQRTGVVKDLSAGTSFGAGLIFDPFALDYALDSYGSAGIIHKFSLSGIF